MSRRQFITGVVASITGLVTALTFAGLGCAGAISLGVMVPVMLVGLTPVYWVVWRWL